MKDYKQVLRLRDEGNSKNEISKLLEYKWRTMDAIIKKANEAKLTSEQASALTNREVQKLLNKPRQHKDDYMKINLEQVHKELSDPHVTVELLFNEYCAQAALKDLKPYSRSQFNKKYQNYWYRIKISNHVKAKPGDKLELGSKRKP
ncbi:MAG: hypothetical protein WCR02_08130 [Sphaerochaetaceae bacterium]